MNINNNYEGNSCYNDNCYTENLCNYPKNNCCHPKPKICKPIKIDCSCAGSIKEVLQAILRVVRNMSIPGFNVDVEITTTSGVIYTMNFGSSTPNPIIISETTISDGITTISICDISKISVLSGELVNINFNTALTIALSEITTKCTTSCGYGEHEYNKNNSCDKCIEDIECAQGMQEYINKNINNIDTIGYQGGNQTIQSISAITDIQYTDVLDTATLTTTNTPVISTVTPANTSVVNNVSLNNIDVVTNVSTANANVSAPITATPTTVVSAVNLVPVIEGVVTNLITTTTDVVDVITTTTTNAVTSFDQPTIVSGVLSGLDTISNVTPLTKSLPAITSANTGLMQVTIPIGAIDGVNPVAPVVLNVQVGGANVTFGGNSNIFTLPNTGTVLGGNTATPALTNITELGTPVLTPLVDNVLNTTTPVIDTVTPVFTEGELVNSITTTQVNNIATPTNVSVVQTVTETTENVNAVDTVSTIPASSLFSTTSQNVINSATLSTTEENVVQSITASTISVFAPAVDDVDGKITSAGDGIVAVNNTNGDISVYSTCDINSVGLTR